MKRVKTDANSADLRWQHTWTWRGMGGLAKSRKWVRAGQILQGVRGKIVKICAKGVKLDNGIVKNWNFH